MMSTKRPPWWQGAALPVVVACLLFTQSLSGDFTFDDRAAVKENRDVVQAGAPWKQLLGDDFWGGRADLELSNKSYRPVTVAVYRLVRELVKPEGGVPPAWPYRLLNLVLHAAVTAQVHALARLFGVLEGHPSVEAYATVAALLFACHPVHVEVVCGAVGAAELLGGLCALAGVRCYARVLLKHSASAAGTAAALFAACILALMGAFAKETALAVLAAYIALEWLTFGSADVEASTNAASMAPVAAKDTARASQSRPWRAVHVLARCFIVIGTAAIYVRIRSRTLGAMALVRTFRVVDNHIPFLPTRQAQLLTALHSHWYYLFLLLWPVRLCADWNYSCIPPVNTWRDTRNAGAIALYVYLIVVALRAQPWRLTVFGKVQPLMQRRVHAVIVAALALAPLFPASNLLVHIGAYLAERLLYLPSVGFCLMYASCLSRTATSSARKPLRDVATAVLALTCVLYALRTLVRVPDWASESVLFPRGAETCPNGAKVRVNAGVQARVAGNCTLARVHFDASLRVLPDDQYCEPMYGLALCAMDEDNAEVAVDYFTRSLGCIETANMAAQALRNVLAGMWAKYPGQPAILLRYAQVATRIGGDERQACAAAGLAAELLRERLGGISAQDLAIAYGMCPGGAEVAVAAAKDGPPPQLTRINTCEDACRAVRAEGSAIMRNASAELPPEMASLAGALTPAHRTELAQRMRFATLARAFLKKSSAACRGTSSYTEAVNALQNLEPYNADLHSEWARMLREMPGRDAEAVQHMNFAADSWAQEAEQMPPGSKETKRAAAHAERARAEIRSWDGVPAGPKSVSSLSSPQLKNEL